MLIAQPIAVRAGRRPLHRMLGSISYGLVPLIVVSVILLAHSRIAGAPVNEYDAGTVNVGFSSLPLGFGSIET